jgi:hypothetical protein
LDVFEPAGRELSPWVLAALGGSGRLEGLTGKRRLPDWVPPLVTMRKRVRGRERRPVDLPWLHGHALVLTARAREALEGAFGDDVEYLPLACDDAELWLVNALYVIDALDDERSVAVRIAGGRIMDLISPVFRCELIADRRCFAIPQVPKMFVTDEVVRAAVQAGLTGTGFRRVWSSATPQQPLDPEGEWRQLTTHWQWNVAEAVAPRAPLPDDGGVGEGHRYDEPDLCARLGEMDHWKRTTFAASCAERLLPIYDTWCAGHSDGSEFRLLREDLDRVWDGVTRNAAGTPDALALADIAGWTLPKEEDVADEDTSHWVALSENAALAVACALQTWATGDPVVAAWAARQAYEAVEQSGLIRAGGVEFNDKSWDRLADDRLVQAELRRQNRDLEELEAAARHDPSFVRSIRTYSTMDTKALLGLDASSPQGPRPQPIGELHASFRAFLEANPPSPGLTRPLDGARLARLAQDEFRVSIPHELVAFWSAVGAGVFGNGELYVFGDAQSGLPGPELLEWNGCVEWRRAFPAPVFGGPIFFAQTAFGNQLGFRWEGGAAIPVLFVLDTAEMFRVATDLNEMFAELLSSSELEDPEKSARARAQLGPLPPGEHYAPDLSPLLGGSGESFHVESAVIHLVSAVAQLDASRKRSSDTQVNEVEVELDWK